MASPGLVALVVDADEVTQRLLRRELAYQGLRLLPARGTEQALIKLADHRPDVILLAADLPERRDLLPLMRRISSVPIIALVPPLDWQRYAIEALALGADAFIRKPPEPDVLLALIDAQLRRAGSLPDSTGKSLSLGDLTVDFERHIVITARGESLCFSRTEWALLSYLALHEGHILTYTEILTHVWGPEYGEEHHLVHDWVSRLRRKLRGAGLEREVIETLPGIGYRLRSVEPASRPAYPRSA